MSEIVVKNSRYSYADMLARLTKAIADGGNTLFDHIDQSAAAQSVGLALRPTTLLIFGNPKGGTPLVDAFPLTALGHPFGATGARILSQAVKELAPMPAGRRAIVSICADGGQGSIALLEAW